MGMMFEIVQIILIALAVIASLFYIWRHLRQALLNGEENKACSHCPLNQPPHFSSAKK